MCSIGNCTHHYFNFFLLHNKEKLLTNTPVNGIEGKKPKRFYMQHYINLVKVMDPIEFIK